MTEDLRQLAALLRAREELDDRITTLIGRPAHLGDIGEFIAARVFDIELADNPVQAGYDGRFRSGPLAGRTVNVKNYGDASSGLDISPHPCDHYLVLSSRSQRMGTLRHHRWGIAAVYLFDAHRLHETLTARGIKIGIATSVRRSDLDAAQIFPATGPATPLHLSPEQVALLSLFTHQAAQTPY